MLLPAGCADSEIDRQLCRVTRRWPDELPALAFCLLFRFQGAEAQARIKTLQVALFSLRWVLALVPDAPFRGVNPLREAEINTSYSGLEAQPAS